MAWEKNCLVEYCQRILDAKVYYWTLSHYDTLMLSLQPRSYRDPSCIHLIRSSETSNGDSSTGRSHDDSHRIHEPSPAARTRSFLHFESTPSWSLGISSMDKSELPLGGAIHIGIHLVYSYTFNPRLVPPYPVSV